jgi:hypothetical protein
MAGREKSLKVAKVVMMGFEVLEKTNDLTKSFG